MTRDPSAEATSAIARAEGAHDASVSSAGENAADEVMDLSAIICSFQRPDLLTEAATTSARQTFTTPRRYEVIVVDNCPEGSAAATVEAVRARLGPAGAPIRYVHEPRTNLSHARNTGVAASRARFVAFVDDDNVVPPTWAEEALTTIEETGADVLFGDVDPVFPPDADPDKIALVGHHYRRRVHAPEGRPIPVKSTGHVPGARTCNVLLRRAVCFTPDTQWFDPVFGLSGGEDTDFFMRLAQRLPDGRFYTSARPLMQETIPVARLEPDVVVQRAFKGSQRLARALVRNSPSPPATWAALNAIALLQLGLAGAQIAMPRVVGRAPSLDRRIAFASAAGKLAYGALKKTATPHR